MDMKKLNNEWMDGVEEFMKKVRTSFEKVSVYHNKRVKSVEDIIEQVNCRFKDLDTLFESVTLERDLYSKIMREKVDIELTSEIFAVFEFLNKRIDELEKRIEEAKKDVST